jgi:hypothetical protein
MDWSLAIQEGHGPLNLRSDRAAAARPVDSFDCAWRVVGLHLALCSLVRGLVLQLVFVVGDAVRSRFTPDRLLKSLPRVARASRSRRRCLALAVWCLRASWASAAGSARPTSGLSARDGPPSVQLVAGFSSIVLERDDGLADRRNRRVSAEDSRSIGHQHRVDRREQPTRWQAQCWDR